MGRTKTQEDAVLYQTIGARVFRLRQSQNMEQAELAERTRLHPNTISRIETGDGISVASLVKIAKVLGVYLWELLPHSQLIVGSPAKSVRQS